MASNTSIGTAWIQIKPSTINLRSNIEKELNASLSESGTTAGDATGMSFGSAFMSRLSKIVTVAAVGKFFKDVIETAGNFEAQMSQVAATLGYGLEELRNPASEAAKNLQTLSDFAKEMGASTVFSASESAQALNYMALAGYDAETSMRVLPSVLNLAAAGNFSLARASDMVTDAQTALGLSLDETEGLVDQMAKTASKTNTSVEQLGNAILTVGGTASYMSGGTAEINRALGVLADNSIKAEEGGIKLRNIILSLSSPTKAGASLLEELGVSIFDAEGKLRSFSEIFPELNNAMANFTDEQKIDAFSTLFNTRDIAAANALLETSKERWTELGGAIDGAEGAAKTMAAVQLDNLKGDITLLKSAFEGLQVSIGEAISPLTRGGVQLGTTFIQFLMGEDVDVGAALTEYISNLVDWVVNGLLSAENLSRVFQGGVELFTQIALALPDIIVKLIDALPDLITNIVEYLTNPDNIFKIVEASVTLFFGIVQAVPRIIGALLEAFGTLFSKLWTVLKENFGKFAANFGDFLGGIFKTAINGVLAYIENFINAPIRLINGFIDLINSAFGVVGVNIGKIGLIQLPRLATGGIVTGVGTDYSDSNLYALSRGEYVVRASAAREIGYQNLEQMNATGDLPSRTIQNYFTINGYDKSPEELATIISRKIALKTQGVLG